MGERTSRVPTQCRLTTWAGSRPVVTVASVLSAAFMMPVLWVVMTREYVNPSDWAVTELRTRDVLSADPPLQGAYSRYGWAHPGPIAFYLYALPYQLLGQDAAAMQMAAIFVNVLTIAATIWLLARRGRAAIAAGACAISATVWAMPPEAIADAWNPTIAVLPTLLTIVACWCALCGDGAAVAVAVIASVFVFQSHIGFGLVVGPLVVATVGVTAWRAVRAARLRSWLIRPAVLIGVTSLPLVADAVGDPPGNLARLVRWTVTNDVEATGARGALSVLGRQTSLSFLTDPQPPSFVSTLVDQVPGALAPGGLLVLLTVALIASVQRGLRTEASLVAVCLGVWATAVVAIVNVRGPRYAWLFGWLQPLGWLSWAAVMLVGWRLTEQIVTRLRVEPRKTVVGGCVAASALCALFAVGHARNSLDGGFVLPELTKPIGQFAADVADADLHDPILIDFAGDPEQSGALHAGLVNRLDRAGLDIVVTPNLRLQFGDHRVVERRPGAHLLVRAESIREPVPTGATLMSEWDSLSVGERAEADRLTADLTQVLRSLGMADRVHLLYTSAAGTLLLGAPPAAIAVEAESINRLAELRAFGGDRYALYLLPQ